MFVYSMYTVVCVCFRLVCCARPSVLILSARMKDYLSLCVQSGLCTAAYICVSVCHMLHELMCMEKKVLNNLCECLCVVHTQSMYIVQHLVDKFLFTSFYLLGGINVKKSDIANLLFQIIDVCTVQAETVCGHLLS